MGALIKGDGDAAGLESYRPFITEGFVSMVGSEVKVPVTILRDTAAFDSFILAGVLPLSDESDTRVRFECSACSTAQSDAIL